MAEFFRDLLAGIYSFRNFGLIFKDGEIIGLEVAIPVLAVVSIIAYLLGSINFAVIISKVKYNEDIRDYGSGNGGTTNMMRTYGKKAAIITFIGDCAKALLAVTIGMALFGMRGGYFAGLFCVIGHCFPIYYKFKGGKGVATTSMVILTLSPEVFLILFIVFAILVLAYKYISLGSVMCMLLYPLILNMFYGPGYAIIIAFLIAVLVIFMHRSNIKRLMNRTESKFEFKKKGARNGDNEEKVDNTEEKTEK